MNDGHRQIIIGLETHVQLATRSKLFCGCSTTFGTPPNTQTCPVCLGLPGSLPVMNRTAFELALKTALALNCHIPAFTKWDRKQYYYPDLPKGYQISQYDLPMSSDGFLEISDAQNRFAAKKVGIIRAHLEEDAGKSMHDEATATAEAGKTDSRIDLNRTGTPLLEIVSEPDLRSPLEARTFLSELKLLLTYLGVSDCNMQEGSLRVDANINLHLGTADDPVATPIVEVKNMNSFRAVERALEYEARRQFEVWQETGEKLGDVPKQTRGWDDQAGVTIPLRSKEESSDYRYFPDPDLVPVTTTAEQLASVRATLGELPAALRQRVATTYEITAYDADVLVNQGREVVAYFIAVADIAGDGKQASNWIQRDVLRYLKEREADIRDFPVPAKALAELIQLATSGRLDNARAPDVFAHMMEHGVSAAQAIQTLGIEAVDRDVLVVLCQELLTANPKVVEDVKQGRHKALGALIGQARKRNPNANPNSVREICMQLIEQS